LSFSYSSRFARIIDCWRTWGTAPAETMFF
jgi:hypothetical protein